MQGSGVNHNWEGTSLKPYAYNEDITSLDMRKLRDRLHLSSRKKKLEQHAQVESNPPTAPVSILASLYPSAPWAGVLRSVV